MNKLPFKESTRHYLRLHHTFKIGNYEVTNKKQDLMTALTKKIHEVIL